MFEVKGKVALITGGAKGIGRSIAKELLENGAKGVTLVDVDAEQGKATAEEFCKTFSENCCIYVNADVTQTSQLEDAFEQTYKTFKHLEIVVNDAGIFNEIKWEKTIAVNFQGCVAGSLLAIDKYFPKHLSNSEGVILNVSSVRGLVIHDLQPVYCGTKHAVIAFSRALSGPNRCHGLKVKILVICPGATVTSMLDLQKDQMTEKFYKSHLEVRKNYHSQTAEELARHAVLIMKEGETGSVWVINSNTSTKIEFPTLFDF